MESAAFCMYSRYIVSGSTYIAPVSNSRTSLPITTSLVIFSGCDCRESASTIETTVFALMPPPPDQRLLRVLRRGSRLLPVGHLDALLTPAKCSPLHPYRVQNNKEASSAHWSFPSLCV